MQVVSGASPELSDFRFDHDDDLSDLGGAASRFRFNVAAIALLKRLEAESRPLGDLTLEERRTLALYTGWGDSDVLGRAFPNGTFSWSRPCAELQELLTPDEIKSLLASTLNAHFTSLPIIRAIYAALDHFGLATRNWIPASRSRSAYRGDQSFELSSLPQASAIFSARCRNRSELIPNVSPSRLIR